MGAIIAECKHISKTYGKGAGKTEALKDVSLKIEQGEFVMILGESGSGKTTLLHILGLMDESTEGEYFFDGQDAASLSEKEKAKLRNKKLGFVFQKYHLIKTMTTRENTELPLGYAKKRKAERREAADAMLRRVGLSEKLHARVSELSGGQQQRVAIARALVGKPEMILADEPTGNLDSRTALEIMELLSSLHEEGNTIVMITHNERLVSYASRVIRLKDGRIKND